MGIATDDSHEYHGQPGSRPGRGWVMVRSRYLTPEHLIRAMKKGDFYASSGVKLKDVQFNESKILSLEIDADANATYKTEFIGTLEHPDEESRIGKVLATSTDPNPSYQMKGNELYVRAPLSPALSTPWTPHSKDKKSRLGLNLWDGTHKKVSYFLLPVPRKRDHRKACCFYNDKPSQPLCAIRRVCGVRWVSGVRLNDFKKKPDW